MWQPCQYYSVLILQMQEQQKQDLSLSTIAFAVLILLVVYAVFKSSKRKQKIRRKLSEAKKKQQIPPHIIIVAFQISNFVVVFSEKYHNNFKLLDSSCKSLGTKVANYLTNMRPCYFLRFTRRAIRAFFKELKGIDNIRLVLYTKLEQHYCSQILENLNLEAVFEQKDRIYTHEDLKYPSEVDHDTGRVIIISANQEDQDKSLTSYHTLILKLDSRKSVLLEEGILTDLKESLLELAERGRVDDLHEDMHELTHSKGLPVQDDES